MNPIFLKLGGSLITDKNHEATPRSDVIRRAASEVKAALESDASLRLVLGHGSGSFGHFAAKRARIMEPTPTDWSGYAATGAAAARLNRLVTDIFLEAGVPVVSLQPSASARCRDGVLVHLEVAPVRELLAHGLVPLVYGDIALDDVRGATIISTEDIFVCLARELRPSRIILTGEVEGVLDRSARLIPTITAANIDEMHGLLGESSGIDVTGGMLAKVLAMWSLVEVQRGLEVRLVSGMKPGLIERALVEERFGEGTVVRWR
jgi:isopentenyl phosphate kinase